MKASEIRELLKLLDQPDIISFAGGIPDPALFPVEAVTDAYAAVLGGADSGSALQYQVSEGYLPLRRWLATLMGGLGVPCDEHNILITSGSQQALDYLGKLFLSPHDTALVTWPTYLGALQAFNAYEPHYERLTPDGGNMTAEAYRAAAAANGGKPKFAYLVPDFANPTGETLGRQQREAVLDLAGELEIAVIEDAAYRALRYDGEPQPPILALTPSIDTARRLALVWGVHALVTDDARDIDDMAARACRNAALEGFASVGQRVIIVAGVPFGTPGATNMLRIAFVGPES